ncbi:MAG: HAMP domain-containing histidine kinase [Deltaproteobacteria bacterium]|nr:HAMP domain-containing histidine kinase [Deltaproteobacteria bacterium]
MTPLATDAPFMPRASFAPVIGALLLAQCGGALAGALLLWRAIDHAREATTHVSVLARERAAMELMLDRALMLSALSSGAQPGVAQRLAEDIDAFDHALAAFERGGVVDGDTLVPLAGPAGAALEVVSARWHARRVDLVTLTRAPPSSSDFAAAAARVEAPLTVMGRELAGLAQVAERRARELRTRGGVTFIVVLVLQVALLAIAMAVSRRHVVEPAEVLARVAERERQAAIDARALLETELRQAAQHDSIGRLAAGIAHEINTPIQFIGDSVRFLRDAYADLRGIIGEYRVYVRAQASVHVRARFAELERSTDLAGLEQSVPDALACSREGLTRMTALVRALKELARPDANELAPVDLNRVVESAITVAHNQCKYVAEVETELGDLPSVTCHASDMARAVLHLLINAAQATGEVTRQSGQKGVIRVRTACEQDRAVLTIADRGAGLATSEGKDIRGNEALAVARSIVDRHGGELSLSSEPGRGTTCCVRLPLLGRSAPLAGAA